MTDSRYDALFDELCVRLGFCSLGLDGENSVKALETADAEALARAVFTAEGLDYDRYENEKVKAGVRACISRHLNLETAP